MWGFILMALVFIAFTWYSKPSEEQIRAQHEADSIAAVQQNEALIAEQTRKEAEIAKAEVARNDSTSALFSARNGEEQRITLENDLVKIIINTHGGVIEEAVLKNYNDQQKEPVRLLTPEDASLTLMLEGKQENIITSDLFFEVAEVKQQPANTGKEASALLRLPIGSGSLDISYVLRPDAYMVDMVVQANGIADLFSPSMRTLDLQWKDRARQLEKGFDF